MPMYTARFDHFEFIKIRSGLNKTAIQIPFPRDYHNLIFMRLHIATHCKYMYEHRDFQISGKSSIAITLIKKSSLSQKCLKSIDLYQTFLSYCEGISIRVYTL